MGGRTGTLRREGDLLLLAPGACKAAVGVAEGVGGGKGTGENQRAISRREEGSESRRLAEDGFLYLGLDSRREQRTAGGSDSDA